MGTVAAVLREEREGYHSSTSSTGCHGGNSGPCVGMRTVELGSVEVDLPVMTSYCKQVATQSRETHSSTTDVHGTHELPGISLRVISGGGERGREGRGAEGGEGREGGRGGEERTS